MGRKGRDDPERRGGGPGRGRERPEGGAGHRAEDEKKEGEPGYKGRVHERLDRMDQRLDRHLKGGDV